MGFDVVDSTLDKEAIVKLEIAANPPTRALLTKLLGAPPRDQALSRKYYEYLASRIAGEISIISLTKLYAKFTLRQTSRPPNWTECQTQHSYLRLRQ